MKKPLKIIGITAAVLVLLLVAGMVTLRILFPAEKIKAMVLPKISEALNRPVTVDGVGFSVFPRLAVTLKNLEVANTTRPGFDNKAPFVHLGGFIIKLNWKSLFIRKLDINCIALDGLQILVEKNKEGSFNFEDMSQPKDSLTILKENVAAEKAAKEKKEFKLPADFNFELESFALTNASAKYVDLQTGTTVLVKDINQEAAFSVDSKMADIKTQGKLVIQGIRIISKDVPKDVKDLTVTVAHDLQVDLPGQKLMINSLTLGLQKFAVTLTGNVSDFMNIPAYQITVESKDISIADLLREIPHSLVPEVADVKAEGSFKLKVTAVGKADPAKPEALPSVQGALYVRNMKAHYSNFPKALDQLDADIRFTENSLRVAPLKIISGQDRVEVTVAMDNFKAPKVDANIKVSVNLAGIKDLAPLPEGVSVSGSIEADVNAKGLADPKDPSKLQLSGRVVLNNVIAVTPALGKPVKVTGLATLTNQAVVLQDLKVLIGGSDIVTNLRVTDFLGLVLAKPGEKAAQMKVELKVVSNNLNLDEILGEPAAESPAQTEAGPATTGDEPLVLPELPNVVVDGTVIAKKITLKKIDVTNVNTKLSVRPTAIDLGTTASLYTGSITHKFRLDLPSTSKLAFQNTFNTERLEANDFITRFKDLVKTDGKSSPFIRKIKEMDGVLYGKMSMKSSFASNGGSVNQIKKNLVGEILLDVFDGRLTPNSMLKTVFSSAEKVNEAFKLTGQSSPFGTVGNMEFKKMHNTIRVKDETVSMDDFTFDSKEGNWNIKGTVTFAGALDFNLADKLTQPLSGQLLSGQEKAGGAAKKGVTALSNKLGAAGAIVNAAADKGFEAVSIPKDREGRVTCNLGLVGSVDSPKPKWNGFGAAGDKAGGEAQTAKKETPKQQVQQQVQKVQQQAQQKVEKAAEPVKQQVQQGTQKAKDVLKKKLRF
ncbi:MAG: AsmA family protein [Fibrobacterota bacterium]